MRDPWDALRRHGTRCCDERGLAVIRDLRAVRDDEPRPTLAEFKALVREQYYMLLIDEVRRWVLFPICCRLKKVRAAMPLPRCIRCWVRPAKRHEAASRFSECPAVWR